jgi:membrane protein insertase Oxa1/YidC/SpoIIIJ
MILVSLQERIQLETARLYKQAGVNPLAGSYSICTLPKIPTAASLALCTLPKIPTTASLVFYLFPPSHPQSLSPLPQSL